MSILPEPEIYTIAGKNVVVATVPPSHGPVYQAHGMYWICRGTHTVSLSLSELLEVANDRGLLDWEHQPARNTTIEDLDLEKVRAYLAQRSATTRQASRFEDVERVLIGMGCAVIVDKNVVPTHAGLLFFGRDPQLHLIQSDVACVLFRETVGASRYADRRIVVCCLLGTSCSMGASFLGILLIQRFWCLCPWLIHGQERYTFP